MVGAEATSDRGSVNYLQSVFRDFLPAIRPFHATYFPLSRVSLVLVCRCGSSVFASAGDQEKKRPRRDDWAVNSEITSRILPSFAFAVFLSFESVGR